MPCLRYKPADPTRRASSEGFTLIELAVAIAIIAILAGFSAAPTTRNWLMQRGLNTAVEQLRGDLQQARLLAVQHNVNCLVTLNAPAVNQYTISLSNKTVDLSTYRGNVVFEGPLGPLAGVVTITFTPWGTCALAACASAQAQLTNEQNSAFYRLRISASGGISKQIWNGANWASMIAGV